MLFNNAGLYTDYSIPFKNNKNYRKIVDRELVLR